jgi:anti-anti-sigma factor
LWFGRCQRVADPEQLNNTSSVGSALLGPVKEARRQGDDLRLGAPQPEVHKLLKLSGFARIMNVFPETDLAVASYS